MQIFLNWLAALSAFGGLILGAINLVRSRAKTIVNYRWELIQEHADVPFVLSSKNFETSLREGLAYLLPGADDIYGQPAMLRLIIRVARRGNSPTTIEFVEIGDEARRVSFNREPGQVGSAVRTLEPNSFFEWGFDFASIARQLAKDPAGKALSPISIRISSGGAKKSRFLKAPEVTGAEVSALLEACERAWPGFPSGTPSS